MVLKRVVTISIPAKSSLCMCLFDFILTHYIIGSYCIAGNFRGRKLSRISRFFSHPRKFSPRNSRHATPIIRSVFAFRESFLCEMLLSYRSAKVFSLENFPLYGILLRTYVCKLNYPKLIFQGPGGGGGGGE